MTSNPSGMGSCKFSALVSMASCWVVGSASSGGAVVVVGWAGVWAGAGAVADEVRFIAAAADSEL